MSSDKIIFRHEDPHGQGDLYFVWQSGGSGVLLATTGSDGTIGVFNRQGQMQHRIVLQGLCCGFGWDADGDILGAICLGTSQLLLWDANTQKKQLIDIGLRDTPTCIMWAKQGQVVAVGTTRGNLAIYNNQTTRRIPVLGKHAKRISCGVWSKENILALGSDDKTLSLSNDEGDSLRVVQLRDLPSDMHFAEMKTDERVPGENTISVILGKRTLYLYHLPEPDSPTELGFQQRYGSLLQHKWFGDGYILLGFSLGHVVAISTHPREVGQELWQVKNHRDALTGLAVSATLRMVASCGDNSIKVHAMGNLQETAKILTLPDHTAARGIDWSADGQLMAVATAQGGLCVFVTQLHHLSAVCAPRVALLSSLAEVTIFSCSPDRNRSAPAVVTLEVEPSFIGLGPQHLVCGMNNHVWFYDLGRSLRDGALLLGDREYMAEVKEVRLTAEFCAVLCGRHALLHPIESTPSEGTERRDPRQFPDDITGMQDAVITSISLTGDFFAFATDLGAIVHFSLEQWGRSVTHRHAVGIRNLYADCDGTRVVVVDDHDVGFLYSPVTEEMLQIPDFPKKCTTVLWDSLQAQVFVACGNKLATTYVHVRHSVAKSHVIRVGETRLLADQTPLLLFDGELNLGVAGGGLTTITLNTHRVAPDAADRLGNVLRLRKFPAAWDICTELNDRDQWLKLAKAALADLEVAFAIRVFRRISCPAMVFALEELLGIEDRSFLAGRCAQLLDMADEAKRHFARSVAPREALELCRDLLQWEEAMALAENIDAEAVPAIAREYAGQLEFGGSHGEALAHYERAMQGGGHTQEHINLCKAGIARTSIKNRDFRRGIQLALELDEKHLLNDCAESLSALGQISDAAMLFERAGNWDSCCGLYIQLKNWVKVDELLHRVTSLKLHAAYAKAREADGKFQDAIRGYTAAGDLDSVVRIYLDQLSDPHSASEIVLETRSAEAAKMLARFYQQIGDTESAIQYLIMCGSVQEAYTLAERRNKVREFGELLEQYDGARSEDFLVLAQHFEAEKYTLLSGKYYFLAKMYSKALKHLLKASAFSNDENIALSLAIDCVASANDDQLTGQLIEFLLGEMDGVPKDPKLLFRLYMAKKEFREAAKAAVIIANQEQLAGKYRSAHNLLFSMYQELRRNNLSIMADMRSSLVLLHRYILVRIHIQLGDHLQAAKLLVQVATNISQFPTHVVPILTSSVIECHRAGLRASAFTFASTLMRPEYRTQIDEKYSRKVEGIVRKAPRGIKELSDEATLEMTPCAACGVQLLSMETTCHQCKTTLPICIATGQHLVADGIAACPECDFPGIKDAMIRVFDATNSCPMCGESVDSNRLKDIEDISVYLSN
ncbi:WD repeat-containing protein 19 isoform X1 [Lutzomyia longipalpis]|uniref:WD repeat-containing protein 19 isoform X1 n=1 Tax=Lutzomyia longipalpis TaxID=7200 RepID=UPI002483B9ED|nr:WD repeat-containing protein 19 isoform X1 [Lutzomyia longipalpis]XP_055683365.1 WD repeat-containing protein 19 isoform X1 [Lutzomyia longipalpis]